MKTLKINVPEGYEIDKDESTFEEIVFKKSGREKLFLELFQGLEIKSDIEKYPNSVFYFRGDKVFLEIENETLWVSRLMVWKVFGDEFDMQDTEIQEFISTMLEKHFKWKGLTPIPVFLLGVPHCP